MERSGVVLTNTAIHAHAGVHDNWLYEHPAVKARADAIRAAIHNDKLTQATSMRTELEEHLKTENAQLIAHNKALKAQLSAVQQALAEARKDAINPACHGALGPALAALQDKIDALQRENIKLVLERETAVTEAKQLKRKLAATQDALRLSERSLAAALH
jgi:predicted nuclease with TOPRIM domain